MFGKHALTLAEKGFAVFPCIARDKRPATKNGVLDATRDPDLIREWWNTVPNFNIGVATGAQSKIFVIDIDRAEAELSKLERAHGELPATVEAITPKGRHIYFRWPARGEIRNSASKIAPGIDIRGQGGYVIAPPSVHPSGKRYYWSVDCGPEIAAAPDWLLSLLTAAPASPQASVMEWRNIISDGAGQGKRDCTVTRVAGYLISRHVDPYVALELLQCWNETRCRPPLPAQDIERIVNSICGRELRKRATS